MKKQTTKSKGIDLVINNYAEVKELEYSYAILPWGATEPHNTHLPYVTDCYLSYKIAVDSAEIALDKHGVRGVVLPPIPFGSQNPGQTELPFCIHSSYDTQRSILTDVVESLLRSGIDKLLIISGHGGNSYKNMIRDMNLTHPDMLVACTEWFKVMPQSEFFELPDDHAGEMETSVMMHYYPELVDLEIAEDGRSNSFNIDAFNEGIVWVPRHWQKIAPTTGVGDPRRATAEKGKKFAAAIVDKLADFYHDLVTKPVYKE